VSEARRALNAASPPALVLLAHGHHELLVLDSPGVDRHGQMVRRPNRSGLVVETMVIAMVPGVGDGRFPAMASPDGLARLGAALG